MLERLYTDYNLASCPEEEKNVVVLLVEMKVKAGLVYSVGSGKIVGFTDVGDIGNEVSSFSATSEGSRSLKKPPMF